MYFDSEAMQPATAATPAPSDNGRIATAARAPQRAIEEKMRAIIALGNCESTHLFSEEGLPIAQATAPNIEQVEQDQIAEMAILLQDVRRMSSVMGGISQLREIVIEGTNRRKIVFRFFESFGQPVVLAMVVPPNTAYRQRTNELEKLIVGESF